jgi:trehalose/maltose hydrolase-like predicted phosphorylase
LARERPQAEPAAADGLRRLAFTLLYRGQLVEFEGEGVTVTSQTAEAAPISVGIGETVTSFQAGSRLELHGRAAPAS